MTSKRSIWPAGALAILIAAGGCVSVLPEQPKPEAVYRLAEPQALAELRTHVVIREPDAPRLFASRTITSQSPDGGLKVVPGVAWADRATRMFQVTLLDAFQGDAPGLAVDDVTGVSGEYELYWRVSKFSLEGLDGVCELQLTLLSGRSRVPVAQQSVSARAASTAKGDLARARALSDAGRLCVEKAAVFIADRAVPVEDQDADALGG